MSSRVRQNGPCQKTLTKIVAVSCLLTLAFSSGCGTLHTLFIEDPETRSKILSNEDPRHIRSCGPEALLDALEAFGENASLTEISIEIQKARSPEDCLREFLAIFNSNARSMTFPNEIKRYLNERGFKIKKIKSLKSLDRYKHVAIGLIRDGHDLTSYHWVCFPEHDIENFFGKNTRVLKIYLITR